MTDRATRGNERARRPGAALLVACLVIGCRAPAAGGGAPTLDGLPQLALEEELRVGHLQDPELGFSAVRGVAVAPDGTMFILDGDAREVRVFDASGNRLRAFGGRGRGPGEFEFPIRLGLVGDTVWVSDPFQNQRITLFGSDGRLITTVPAQPVPLDAAPGLRAVPQLLRADGTFASGIMYSPDAAVDSVIVPRLRFDMDGQVVDTTGRDVFRFFVRSVRVHAGAAEFMVTQPHAARTLQAPAPHGRVVLDQPPPASVHDAWVVVARHDAEDRLLWSRRFAYRPAPADPARTDAIVDSLADFWARDLNRVEVQRQIRASLHWPEFVPPFDRVMLGDDGTAWLRRSPEPGRPPRWIVLQPDGEPLGELTLPDGASPEVISAERVWVVEPDDFDVPYVVRYGILPAPSS